MEGYQHNLTQTDESNPSSIAAESVDSTTRKLRWEQQLLDLSLHNPLLSLDWNSDMLLPLLLPAMDAAAETLTDGNEYRILPCPEEVIPPNGAHFEALRFLDQHQEWIDTALQKKQLHTPLSQLILSQRMGNLYQVSQMTLEESGSRSLYLALGLLRWYETPSSEQAHYAPLVLLPAELVRQSPPNAPVLRLREEDVYCNPTLLELLQQRFDLSIPGLHPLSECRHGAAIRQVLTLLRQSVRGNLGWDIMEAAVLGAFPLSQFFLWNDLHNRPHGLERNKVVRSLLENQLCWEPEPIDLSEPVSEDSLLLPITVDAFQLRAVHAASEGKSVVLYGPPGTGKSQTITAIIANALGQGKTVLFAAQKKTALSVVYRRLTKLGLSSFCLALYPGRSKKQDVLNQLKQAAETTAKSNSNSLERVSLQLTQLRETLNSYRNALHQVQPSGLSLFQMIDRYEGFPEELAALPFPHAAVSTLTAERLAAQRSVLEQLLVAGRAVGHPFSHPLAFVTGGTYTFSLRTQITELATTLSDLLHQLQTAAAVLTQHTPLPSPESETEWQTLAAAADILSVWNDLPPGWATADHELLNTHLTTFSACWAATAKQMQPVPHFQQEGAWPTESFSSLLASWEDLSQSLENLKTLLPDWAADANLAEDQALLEQWHSLLTWLDGSCQTNAQLQRDIWEMTFCSTTPPSGWTQAADTLTRWQESCQSPCPLAEPEPLSAALTTLLAQLLTLPSVWQTAAQAAEPLTQGWNDTFLTLDVDELEKQWNQAAQKWFLPRWQARFRVRKQLSPYARKRIKTGQLAEQFILLHQYQTVQARAQEAQQNWQTQLDLLRRDWDAQCTALTEQWCSDCADFCTRMQHLVTETAALWQTVSHAMQQLDAHPCGQALLDAAATLPEVLQAAAAFHTQWALLMEQRSALSHLVTLTPCPPLHWFTELEHRSHALTTQGDQLREWFIWCNVRKAALTQGLSHVITAYEQGMATDTLLPAYEKGVVMALALDTLEHEPALNTFSGTLFNESIRQFRQADMAYQALSRMEIRSRLVTSRPDCTRVATENSELRFLQQAIRSQGEGVQIQQLFSAMPNLIPRLCPCLLMSPSSAAQYLSPNGDPFDLVILDEASQLPTSQAVGVLARGENAIIAGDPNQLPPTPCFPLEQKTLSTETEPLDSILADCLDLNMPQISLFCHYRSQHESLIAFSNSQFYHHQICSFPSVSDQISKVSLVRIDRCFDGKGSDRNRAEAEAVVTELIARFHAPDQRKQTIGVVVLHTQQQRLIQDLFETACAQDSALDEWAHHGEKPLWIKYPETVQGDERDVILLSVGFAPDLHGTLPTSFQPLDQAVSWRRLNTAVTRARQELKVFTSLSAADLSLSPLSTRGMTALQTFLQFAEGKTWDCHNTKDESAIQIALQLQRRLEQAGYQTQTQVGRSRYQIDLAVRDPRQPSRYLLGILLDGAHYRDAKTTRDRELAENAILTERGWQLHRVWTLDYWDNPVKEQDRILQRLEELAAQPLPQTPEEKAAIPEIEPRDHTPADEASKNLKTQPNKPSRQILSPALYQITQLEQHQIKPDAFSGWQAEIKRKLLYVVEQEAPVFEGTLIRRVIQSFGLSRTGSKIQQTMVSLLAELSLPTTQQNGFVFYWKNPEQIEQYLLCRSSGSGENRRDAREVPVQEAVNALCLALYQQVSMNEADLIREAAKWLGYNRLGQNVTVLIQCALQEACRLGRIKRSGTNQWALSLSRDVLEQLLRTNSHL